MQLDDTEAQLEIFLKKLRETSISSQELPKPIHWGEAFGLLKAYLKKLPSKKKRECGFVTTMPQFGKIKREEVYRLVDEYSIFYHRFIKKNRR